MVSTKTLFAACGAVAVGASECSYTVVQAGMGACEATGIKLDAIADLWFTTAYGQFESNCSKVWMCPEPYSLDGDAACKSVGLAGGDWTNPSGIAVDRSNMSSPTIYISELGRTARKPNETSISPGVKKCIWSGPHHTTLACRQFGSNWNVPHSLDVDHEGNVLVTVAHTPSSVESHGVWKCSPSGDCFLVGGSEDGKFEQDVAADSKGNIYVAGVHAAAGGSPPTVFVEKCTSTGTCEDFGPTQESVAKSLGIAVDIFDNVYIADEDNMVKSLVRCSPDGSCEDIAPCHGRSPSGIMTIHNHSIFTVVPGPYAQLEVRRFEPRDTILV